MIQLCINAMQESNGSVNDYLFYRNILFISVLCFRQQRDGEFWKQAT